MLDFACFVIDVPKKEEFKKLHDAVLVAKLLKEAKEAVAQSELESPELKGLSTDELWNRRAELPGANELRKLKEKAAELEAGLRVVDEIGNVAKADPGVTVDLEGGKVSFNYVYKDCLEKFRSYRAQLGLCGVAGDKTIWMRDYATVEYLRATTDLIDGCRDHYRGFDFPELEDPGIDDSMAPTDAAKQLFKGAKKGFCLGNKHDDQNSKDFLYDGIDSGDLMGAGGLLFIEEFKTWIQPDINDYLTNPDAEMSPALKKYVTDLNTNFHLTAPKDFKGILEKAKEKGLKVIGIDAGEADAGDCPSSSFGERRTVTMNKVAEDIIQQALKDNPGKEFIALVGRAHSNTHEGGVPGLSQILGIPAVVLDDSDKLALDPEDKSLRTMPDKASQHLIDRLGKQVDFRALSEEGIDTDAVRAGLVKLAEQLAASTGVDKGGRPTISEKELGKLIDKLIKEFPGKGLAGVKEPFKRLADGFLRDAEHAFLQKEVADGKKLSAKDLASLIVLKAEDEAWRSNRDADEWAGVEVNKKKHDKVIADLSRKLADIVDSPEKAQTALADMPKALASSDEDGEPLFHVKPSEEGGFLGIGKHERDPDHVSIKSKEVHRVWVEKLARLLDGE